MANNRIDPEIGRQWFEKYVNRLENEATLKSPKRGMRYNCPCCGYPTLRQRGGFEVCELCQWEDDGQDDPHADDVWGGPNGVYSLTEARTNFKRFLIMYNPEKSSTSIIKSNTESEQRYKRAIMESFDAMTGKSESKELAVLWQNIYKNEQLLEKEVNRRILAYENQTQK